MRRLLQVLLSLFALVWLTATTVGQGAAPEALESLGEKLFFDTRLSADQRTSCATCHRPELAFQDGRRVSIGVAGRAGTRNTPSLIRVNEQTSMFWDGRRRTLEDQALDPLLNEVEHGLASSSDLIKRLDSLPEYSPLQALGEIGVQRALAAFQRSLTDGENAFERFIFRGERTAIPDAAARGWQLFSGRARCVECHQVSHAAPAMLTDHLFHNVARSGQGSTRSVSDLARTYMRLRNEGLDYSRAVSRVPELAQLGRFVVTLNPKDIGRFKTPSLRNVGLTAPYMHDGSISTLQEAVEVEIYYRGSASGRPLILLDSEKADLVAFLQSLTADALQHAKPQQGTAVSTFDSTR